MVEIDESTFPLIEVQFTDEFGPEEWTAFTAMQERYFAEGKKIGVVVIADKLGLPELSLLKEVSAWVKANEDNMRSYVIGTSLHIPSAVVRGALKFVNSLAPPPSPQHVAKDLSEARRWVRDRLRRAL